MRKPLLIIWVPVESGDRTGERLESVQNYAKARVQDEVTVLTFPTKEDFISVTCYYPEKIEPVELGKLREEVLKKVTDIVLSPSPEKVMKSASEDKLI